MKKRYLYRMLIIIFVAVTLFYLVKPLEPKGIYVAKYNVKTIDSLWIETEFYKRSIYDAKSEKLLFSNQDKWNYKNGRLTLLNFFPNDDEVLKPNYDFQSVLMTFSIPLEKSFGREAFNYNEISGKYMFYKLYFQCFSK